MTSTTDSSPPADDSAITTDQSKNSQHRMSRLNQALACVGMVAGGLFIVAAIFFAGFFLSWGSSPWDHHMEPGTMACCSQMKPGEQMMKPDEHIKPGAMMGPGAQMTPGGVMSPTSHMTPGDMMPGGMMGPAPQSSTTSPITPRP
jgi:hypothetical protein